MGGVLTNINVPTKVINGFNPDYILICDRHKNNKANLELLEDYKSKYIANSSSSHKDFSMNISISFHVNAKCNDSYEIQSETSQCDELDMAICYKP